MKHLHVNRGRRQNDLPATMHSALYALLASLAAIAAMLFGALPAWASAVAIAAFGFGALSLYRGWPRLPGFLLAMLGLAAMLGVWLWFHTLNGAAAGVSLLLLIVAVKCFETRNTRDLMVVALSAYLLTASLFLFGQGILRTLFGLANLVWLTAVLQQIQSRRSMLSTHRLLAVSGGRIAAAIPLMLMLFVLFPRIDGPLWGRLPDRGKAVTGLSDHMSPGAISQLVRSQAIAFRAHFPESPPPPQARYWRAYVLDRFNGRSWHPGPPAPPAGRLRASGRPITYTLLLQASDHRAVPVLGWPVAAPPGTRLIAGHTLRANRIENNVRSFRLHAAPTAARLGARLPPAALAAYLRLPTNAAPRAYALARRWKAADPAPRAVIARALRYFHDQPFYYTLNPPRLNGDITDRFLFDTRQGFCEDYASAFAVLMRAANIPARVVVGYMGGRWNAALHYFTVRDADAHAWVEVWLHGRGWTRVDPTAAVAASRVEAGTGATAEGGLGLRSEQRGWLAHWGDSLRSGWDTAGYLWDTWVIAFGPAEQRALLHRLGLRSDWGALAGYLAAGFALLAAIGFAWAYWRHRPPPPTPEQRLYQRYLRRLRRHGLSPARQEGVQAFALRLARDWPALAASAGQVATSYQEARFAAAGPGEQSRSRRLARLRQAVAGALADLDTKRPAKAGQRTGEPVRVRMEKKG